MEKYIYIPKMLISFFEIVKKYVFWESKFEAGKTAENVNVSLLMIKTLLQKKNMTRIHTVEPFYSYLLL